MEEAPKKSKNPYDTMDIADTNIGNLGTDLEHKIKEAAAEQEDAWTLVGKKEGLAIWRIEKFKVKTWPQSEFGSFYKGDSYIILNTYKIEQKLCFNVHFWLGESTTLDESGTAAYKTTELSDYIHGHYGSRAVHYREVQGEESNLFDKYFNDKLFYLSGGIDSGFNHVVKDVYEPRLIHIKGRKKVKAWEVPREMASLNSGDIFIMDMGAKLLQWNGSKANGMEKNKAAKFVQQLESQRNGRAKGDCVDEFQSDADQADFFEALGGGTKADIVNKDELSDTQFEVANTVGGKKLFRVNDQGSLDVVAENEAVKDYKLDGSDIFVLDMCGLAVYEWIGETSSSTEKSASLKLCCDYLKSIGKTKTHICRVYEGFEHSTFWTDYKS